MTDKYDPADARLKVLFLGAFPDPEKGIFGGNVACCQALLNSSFPRQADLIKIDSAQERPPPPLHVRLWRAVRRLGAVLRALIVERPDAMLIIASSGFSFLEKSTHAWLGRAFGVPSVLMIRSGHFIDLCERSAAFRAVAGVLLRAPRYLPCQGERLQQHYGEAFGIPDSRCPVIENWVASQTYLDLVDEPHETDPRAPVRFLFLGWVERFKGVFELLDAMEAVATDPSMPAVELLVAGNGSDMDEARGRASSPALRDRVRFLGWTEGEEKLELFRQSDIFVLPSHTEGLPNAMVEAMATGLPVIVTPVGSIPDVVRDGENGLLVPVEDAGALAAAMKRLIADPVERARLGYAGHETAATRFALEPAARRLISLLKDVGCDEEDGEYMIEDGRMVRPHTNETEVLS